MSVTPGHRFWIGATVLILAEGGALRPLFLDSAWTLRSAITHPRPDTVQANLARYEPVRPHVRSGERLGFVSDLPKYNDWVFDYLVAQYALAPAVLLRTRVRPYSTDAPEITPRVEQSPEAVVGSYRGSPPQSLVWGSSSYSLIQEFGDGVGLYERRR